MNQESLIALVRFAVFIGVALNIFRHLVNLSRVRRTHGWGAARWYFSTHLILIPKAGIFLYYLDKLFFDDPGFRRQLPSPEEVLVFNALFALYWIVNLFPYRARGQAVDETNPPVSEAQGTVVRPDGSVDLDS